MANSELPVRFTENNYATKNDVARELHMTIIDNIWNNVLNYRSNFYQYLTIKSISNNQMIFCGCPAVSSLANATDTSFIRANKSCSRLNDSNGQLRRFEAKEYAKCLKDIAVIERLSASESDIDGIAGNGVSQEINDPRALLFHYKEALDYIKKCYVNPINDDFLAALYMRVTGDSEITRFYRNVEDTNVKNQYQIGRVYTCAPVMKIEPMMNGLYAFIERSTLNASAKAMTVIFYINYIKPFTTYNYEISILMAKAVLAHEIMDESAIYLELENMSNALEFEKLSQEVQKTSDLTYFVNWALRASEKACAAVLDDSTNAGIEDVRQDFYRVDENKPEQKAEIQPEKEEPAAAPVPAEEIKPTAPEKEPEHKVFTFEPEPPVTNEVSAPAEDPEKPVSGYENISLFDVPEEAETKAEEPATVSIETKEPEPEPENKPVQEPEPEKKTETAVVEEKPEPETASLALAVSLPAELDEKEAKKLEKDLLETDPELKKGEAKFYARHCTIGKKYTIAQYKKEVKCVYETARTSMEHLAKLGYYRKEQVKNKFVYSPIPRK